MSEATVLTDSQTRRYARQIRVAELGVHGQQRLCAASVCVERDAGSSTATVALDYLARAGVAVTDRESDATAFEVRVDSEDRIHALAGDPALVECAAWLRGAFAAVETIKHLAGAGTPGTLDTTLVLAAEVT